MDKQLVADLRKEFDELVEVLEGDGFCTKRECMCDHAKPVVRINEYLTKLEQEAARPLASNGQTFLIG